MSNAITDRPGSDVSPPGGATPPVRETAPSLVAADEPSLARTFGMIGLFLFVLGAASWLIRRLMPDKGFGLPPLGTGISMMLGLACLIFHAVRDGDLQVRRAYAGLGYFWLAVGILLACLQGPAPTAAVAGAAAESSRSLFLPYGYTSLIIALLFLLSYLRNEDDAAWRRVTFWCLGLVGWACTGVGLIGGFISTSFLLPTGLLLALLGLAYLWGFASLRGAGEEEVDPSWYLGGNVDRLKAAIVSTSGGVLLGAVGILTVMVAMGLSFLPQLFYRWNWIEAKPPTDYLEGPGVLLMFVGLFYTVLAAGMYSDGRFIVLMRRELASFFYSPLAYVAIFCFAGIATIHFAFFVNIYSDNSRMGGMPQIQEPVVYRFIWSLVILPIIAQILVVPLLTMRLLSEEDRSGTLEVLLTSPVNDTPVVLSKFFAVLIIYFLTWLPYGLFLLALRVGGEQNFDYRPLISFAITLMCSGASYLGMGLFFSSVTRNQVVAGVFTAVGMVVLLGMIWISREAKQNGFTTIGALAESFSIVDLWMSGLHGRLYLRDVLFQASMGAFWVFLTLKVLESRRWR